jgi:hypothetical protein
VNKLKSLNNKQIKKSHNMEKYIFTDNCLLLPYLKNNVIITI